MYLPKELPQAQVLITVKTYPQPSHKYAELVCTAGLLPDGTWIRIYPIPFRSLPFASRYSKYSWIQLDLVKNTKDFRPESYRPRRNLEEPIRQLNTIGSSRRWADRKEFVLKEVHTSMEHLIGLAKGDTHKSLGTLKPSEIVDFVIEEDEREWKPQWLERLKQYNFLDVIDQKRGRSQSVIRKLPYKYYYRFLSEGDKKPRRMMIEDWEIGALYWNCLARAEGDEQEANRLVRQKYFDTFREKNDIYLFLGTTKQYHLKAPNPFVIIGVFYPPKSDEPEQLALF